MTRRELRENTFKLLFIKEFHPYEDMKEQFDLFMEKIGLEKEEDRKEIYNRAFEIMSKIGELDKELDAVAQNWKTNRMGRVEISILRLALYEITYDENIPNPVAINEAVEIAKKYGGEDTPSFINGILAKLV